MFTATPMHKGMTPFRDVIAADEVIKR